MAAAQAATTDAAVIERANAYFNGVSALQARFTQTGADGNRLTGTLYVQRPGRLRFAYDRPATIDVIADGRSVAIRDRKLATQDLYPVSQTPLKFLLGDRIAIGQSIPVLGVERTGSEADIVIEDRSTLGGTSRITLTFDAAIQQLKGWNVVDPQGFVTRVALSGVETTGRLDPNLFIIDYQQIWTSSD